MLRIDQRVFTGDVKLVELDVVEKHVDAAQVVGGDVDFLPKKSVPNCVTTKDFFRFQQ